MNEEDNRRASDLVVIGAGPAGTAAALRAAALGASVTIVEADRVGGVCTNTGCTPVRVLARTARLARDARAAATFGVELGPVTVHWDTVRQRIDEVVEDVHRAKALPRRFSDAGVEFISGRASFVGDHQLQVDGPDGAHTIEFGSAVIAVGGHSRRLSMPGADLAVLGEHVLHLSELPGRVVIIGSGSTGVQLATVLRAFGSEVVIVEVADRLMPTADADISATLADAFANSGIDVRTSTSVTAIETDGSAKRVVLDGDEAGSVATDEVIMCAGWPASSSGLGLSEVGIAVERDAIVVDPYLRTTLPHVFACGDVNGQAMLVQAAHAEGEAAAVNAVLGPRRTASHGLLPWGGFTDPDIAGVGLTEDEARAQHGSCIVGRAEYAEMERPIIDARTTGFLKVVLDPRRELILGAHAAGENAVEVVTAVATSMAGDVGPATLAMVEYAYPSYSAIIGEACRRAMETTGTDR